MPEKRVDRRRAVRSKVREKLSAKLVREHRRKTGEDVSENLKAALNEALASLLLSNDVKLNTVHGTFRKLLREEHANTYSHNNITPEDLPTPEIHNTTFNKPLSVSTPRLSSVEGAGYVGTAAPIDTPASTPRLPGRPQTARVVSATALRPTPPLFQRPAGIGPVVEVEEEGVQMTNDISCLWPTRTKNPKIESLHKQAEDEWAQKMKSDIVVYHESLRKQKMNEVTSAHRHKVDLDTQVTLRKQKKEQEKAVDLDYAQTQQRLHEAMEMRETQLRDDKHHTKLEARKQMLDEIRRFEAEKSNRESERRLCNATLRKQMQEDADALKQDELIKSRRRHEAYEAARQADTLAKKQKIFLIQQAREQEEKSAKEAQARTLSLARARATEQRQKDIKQERLLSFGDRVFTEDMKANLQTREKVAEKKAIKEMDAIQQV